MSEELAVLERIEKRLELERLERAMESEFRSIGHLMYTRKYEEPAKALRDQLGLT